VWGLSALLTRASLCAKVPESVAADIGRRDTRKYTSVRRIEGSFSVLTPLQFQIAASAEESLYCHTRRVKKNRKIATEPINIRFSTFFQLPPCYYARFYINLILGTHYTRIILRIKGNYFGLNLLLFRILWVSFRFHDAQVLLLSGWRWFDCWFDFNFKCGQISSFYALFDRNIKNHFEKKRSYNKVLTICSMSTTFHLILISKFMGRYMVRPIFQISDRFYKFDNKRRRATDAASNLWR